MFNDVISLLGRYEPTFLWQLWHQNLGGRNIHSAVHIILPLRLAQWQSSSTDSPPAIWRPRPGWCRRWCRRRPPTPGAQWSSRTSEKQLFLIIYQYNYRDRASDDSEIEWSYHQHQHADNYPDRVGDDGAKGATNVGKWEEHWLLWSRHPPVLVLVRKKQQLFSCLVDRNTIRMLKTLSSCERLRKATT